MKTNEVREKYLNFFKEKGHVIIPSAPLVPENDPTTLFTSSGMQPLVPFLMGESHPLGTRLANSQKCFRADDIDEIGDNRHLTFFEMLGNWSLGDYFKKEQISWVFEFLTKELKLDPNKMYISVFRGQNEAKILKDEDAAKQWQNEFAKVGINAKIVDFPEENGMQGGRIFYYPEKKNWWSRAGTISNMPVGEIGGPDSEIFYDFDADLKTHENSLHKNKPCHINCDCGRYMEIGNSVFMQYIKTSETKFELLPKKNIDFGGGLERLTAATNNNPDVFLIDVFQPAIAVIEALSSKKYGDNYEDTAAFRAILDHLRAATFLIGEDVVPSNKDQGYFTRRLIRRAIRFGYELNISGNCCCSGNDICRSHGTTAFCGKIADTYINAYKNVYPALEKKRETILKEINNEENKFQQTIKEGLKIFEQYTENQQNDLNVFASKIDVSNIISSLSLPKIGISNIISSLNLTEKGIKYLPMQNIINKGIKYLPMQNIINIFQNEAENNMVALSLYKSNRTNLLPTQKAFFLYQSYGFPIELTQELAKEKGFRINTGGFAAELEKHQNISRVGSEKKFKCGLADNSEQSTKYHTVTHLLHAALRQVLGNHIEQRGSNITPERLRFDFSHPQKMTEEEKQAVETLVNKWIEQDLEVVCEEMSNKEADEKGVHGIFKDKYEERVKVYTIGDVSCEKCGGPHVKRTGELGKFKIKKEQSISAGVRRIKAVLE